MKGTINALLSDQNSVSAFADLSNGNSFGTAVVAAGAIEQFIVTLAPAAELNLVTSPVPEPSIWALTILGFGAMGAVYRCKQTGRRTRFA